MSARQCLKRLWLEVHMPEQAVLSAATRAAFSAGHAVGAVARRIYGTPGSVLIPYEGGLQHAIRKTTRLLNEGTLSGARFPVFEATLAFGGVLVRIDVLLPDGHGWRIIEVKSSTSVKDEHLFDTAVQSWVFRGLGYSADQTLLAHIDNEYVYPGGDDYLGLLCEVDIGADVQRLHPEVASLVKVARDAVGGGEPEIVVGKQCNTPYECPFIGYCWPRDEFPVQTLPRASKGTAGEWIRLGITDLRHGNLLDEDWVGRNRFARGPDRRQPLPLPGGVRCFAVAACLGAQGDGVKSHLLGDGLVPMSSALGRHADPLRALGFPEDRQWVGYGMNHMELLGRVEVFERLKEWLR